MSEKVKTQLLPSQDRPTGQRTERKSRREEEEQRRRGEDSDPLRIPNRHPRQGTQPHWFVTSYVHERLAVYKDGRHDSAPKVTPGGSIDHELVDET